MATAISYVSLVINIVTGLLYTPWLLHQLGDVDYGIYSIGTSIIALLIMDFGMNEAVAKYVAEYRAKGKEEEVSNLISLVLKIYLFLAFIFLAIFVILYFFIDVIYAKMPPEELIKLRNVYIIVAAYNVVTFAFTPLSGVMLAYEYLASLKICDIINRLAVIAITIIAIRLRMGLYAAVTANAIAGIIVILYKLYIVRREKIFKINLRYKNKKLLKMIMGFSVWVAVLTITQRCIYSITPSILGAFSGSIDVTRYSFASMLEGYAYSFGCVVSTLFLAKISRQFAVGDVNGFDDLVRNAGKIQIIIISIIMIGFICVGQDFICLWLGSGYEIVYYMAIILLLPDFFLWPFMTANVGLTVVNMVKAPALVNLFTALINIGLECVLAGKWGAVGAVISIAVANGFKGITLALVYRKYLPIRFKLFFKEVFLLYGSVFLLALAISYYFVTQMSRISGWFGFVTKGVTVVVLYGLICGVAVLIKDRELIKKLRGYLR